MIGFLKGKIELLKRPFVYIDVNGVGYRVLVSDNIYKKLSVAESIKIYTYNYVREDAFELFGFLDMEELDLLWVVDLVAVVQQV
jgi:Holliday junction DNA helicase RuvA